MSNSNNDILANVSTSIDAFLSLPVYNFLAGIQTNDIVLKNFVPSKDNQHILSGTQETFRQIDPAQFDFTLPVKTVKPDKPVKPDPFTGKAKQEYYDLLETWSDWDTTDEALLNVEIDRIATKLIQHDIIRKYQRLQRVCQFVSNHDASQFDHDEELDLFELPETTRNKILQVYKSAFNASPRLEMTGSYVDLSDFENIQKLLGRDDLGNPIASVPCSLDSIEAIDTIIKVKNIYQSASYAFMGREQLVQVIKAVKNELNAPSLLKLASRLDSHLGGSKNATTIIANLRMLYGFKPTKGKTKTAN